jgi:hypothetical protein
MAWSWLLDRTNLGGVGSAIAMAQAARGAIITAPAAYPVRDAMFVAYQARGAVCPTGSYTAGIGALAVTADPGHRLYSAWCVRLDGRGAPIVTTTDGSSNPIVWVVGAEGDDRLHGFRGDTGQEDGADDRMAGHCQVNPGWRQGGRRARLTV